MPAPLKTIRNCNIWWRKSYKDLEASYRIKKAGRIFFQVTGDSGTLGCEMQADDVRGWRILEVTIIARSNLLAAFHVIEGSVSEIMKAAFSERNALEVIQEADRQNAKKRRCRAPRCSNDKKTCVETSAFLRPQ